MSKFGAGVSVTKKGDQEKISTTLSSEWENGNTGPLRTLEPLDVQLVRDESQMLVQAEYIPEPTNTEDVFNAFQSMRILYYQQHPELAPPTDTDAGDVILEDDVFRVAQFICEREAARSETERVMKRFDPKQTGRITRKQWDEVLNEECEKLTLTKWEQTFFLFEEPTSSKGSFYIALIVMALIVMSSLGFIMASDESFQEYPDDDGPPSEIANFAVLEAFCIICFSVEYLCRAFTVGMCRPELAEANIPYRIISPFLPDPDAVLAQKPGCGQATYNYLSSTMNLIDIVAIVPWYIEQILGAGAGQLAVLRVLRLARVFRIFKVGKHAEGITMLANVMVQSLPALNLLAFFGAIGVVCFGSMIYFAEKGDWQPPNNKYPKGAYLRPDVYGNEMANESPFSSIPRSFWWVMTTATTVGYGDLYPTTAAGKVIAVITMIAGLLVLALPITIIGANFAQEYEHVQEKKKREAERASGDEGQDEDEALAEVPGVAIEEVDKAKEAGTSLSRYLYNAWASLRTMQGVDLVEEKVEEGTEMIKVVGKPTTNGGTLVNKGPVTRNLEKHSTMIDAGQKLLDVIQELYADSKISDVTAANIAREVQGLMRKVVKKSCTGSHVDATVQIVLIWIQRAVASDEKYQLDADGEWRLRHAYLNFVLKTMPS